MTELTTLASHHGVPTFVVAAVVYIVLRSDITFVYPRRRD